MANDAAGFRLNLRVYIEDTDAGGIVYYVNYLKYMERARTEFMRSLGFDKLTIFEQEQLFVVHKVEADYHLPAVLDDALEISAVPERIGRAYIDFRQSVYRGDALLCEAGIRVVCLARATMKPTAIPVFVRDSLLKHQ
jgi:4-hydroxybenzoyl-CoA thioesterase/acyl-CoA thioester hydrolase